MADGTHIEWTDATWNPITGCSVVSPGCTNCYAMKLAGTRLRDHPSRAGLTTMSKGGPVWNGALTFNANWLGRPIAWKRPRKIFVCAHGDLFHQSVPDFWIDQVFAIMALAPRHVFQVLTKRPERMRDYLRQDRLGFIEGHAKRMLREALGDPGKPVMVGKTLAGTWPWPHVWLGVSVEDQARADERIPILLDTPAAVRWISAEPLLGPLDLEPWLPWSDEAEFRGESWGCIGCEGHCPKCPKNKAHYVCDEGPKGTDGCPEWIICDRVTLDWVVAGGESGPGARPMHPDWARSLRDQCAAAGVPFLFKQHGEWIGVPDLRRLPGGKGPGFGAFDHHPYDQDHECVRVGKKAAGRLLDGVEHNGYPEVRR